MILFPKPSTRPGVAARRAPPRRFPVCATLLLLWFVAATLLPGGPSSIAAWHDYRHILVLGDAHIPGEHPDAKAAVLRTIGSWRDVDLVVAVGDLCEDRGTTEEYGEVKRFFAGLAKPLEPVPGNHDVVYRDETSAIGRRLRGDEAARSEKRRRFREVFGLAADFRSRREGGYLLVFLVPERAEHLVEMSYRQVAWLRRELERNPGIPTIVFFHAPLGGTLPGYNSRVNTPDYIAQPADRIRGVLMDHPQVFLWVSGHTHTVPFREGFASAVNLYEERVTNIHCPDLDRTGIWTNSLYLFPDRVVVRTYDHRAGAWIPELERTIRPPVPPAGRKAAAAGTPAAAASRNVRVD